MKHILTIINHRCHCEARLRRMKQSLFPFKNITGHVLAIMIVMLFATGLFASRTAFAEVRTFEKEYTYQASEIDSKVTSRAIAVEQVKRLVLEELGTYLMAETEVRDFQITKDRVVMLTAGIVQTEILNEKWDGERYYLKARIKADPREVAASLDTLRKDVQKSKELEDLKKRTDNAYKEIEKLKAELASVKTDKNKQREYAKVTNTLSATEWALKGTYADPNLRKVYTIKGDSSIFEKYDQDKKVKSSNVGRPPENPLSFTDEDLEKYKTPESKERDKKIEALTKAIALDPNLVYAYINRGNAYFDEGQYDRAIKDYSRAIALNPDDAYIYGVRGLAYINSGQYGLHP